MKETMERSNFTISRSGPQQGAFPQGFLQRFGLRLDVVLQLRHLAPIWDPLVYPLENPLGNIIIELG